MNKEIEAIEIALIILCGFIGKKFPEGKLEEFLDHAVHEFAKKPEREKIVALLTAMAHSASRASTISHSE